MARALTLNDALQFARAATQAVDLRASRESLLTLLQEVVPHDGAIVHALSPRVPLTTAVIRGLDPVRLAAQQGAWDDLSVELGALRERANAMGAASLDEVYPPGAKAGAAARRLLRKSLGMRSLVIVHLVVRERLRGGVILMRKRSRAFDAAAVGRLRALAPLLSVCDALHEELDDVQRTSAPLRMQCRDTRLTPRQQQVVEHVALGHSNAQIAEAMGTSPHTVRNTLVRIFVRIGASNRADLVRLAVLSPASPSGA